MAGYAAQFFKLFHSMEFLFSLKVPMQQVDTYSNQRENKQFSASKPT